MRIRHSSLTSALALIIATAPGVSAQDSPSYQTEVKGQFGEWLKLNVKPEEKAKLGGIDPAFGSLEFPENSIIWKFVSPSGASLADRDEVRKTLEGVFARYLAKDVQQALGGKDLPSPVDQLLAGWRANNRVKGFDLGTSPPPPPQKGMPLPSGQAYPTPQISLLASPTVPMAAAMTSMPRVPRADFGRDVLVQGKSAGDWEDLFHLGNAEFRAGRYRRACDYFAAASELGDDPRAWDFLALASLAAGETADAREAARYAAACIFRTVEYRDKVGRALLDVNGELRDRLWRLQRGVDNPKVANAVLAARPRVISPAGRDQEVEVANNREGAAPARKPLD